MPRFVVPRSVLYMQRANMFLLAFYMSDDGISYQVFQFWLANFVTLQLAFDFMYCESVLFFLSANC